VRQTRDDADLVGKQRNHGLTSKSLNRESVSSAGSSANLLSTKSVGALEK
jgi:hypothetical protein